ncbi:hypothetical protein BRC89_10040 [Halobacteriales archaeon QS_4_70_19]|nr:MAG: hypothetical protein BRC89_10040 [Halobacteriales archaeon QS_4_70_19]
MPSRRHLLTVLGASAAGLAGCTAGPGETPTGTDDTPTDTTGVDGPTPTAPGDAPTGPAVQWTAYLGPVRVSTVTATPDGVYAVGGTNDRSTTTASRDYVKPDSSRNLVAFTPGGERRWRYESPAGVFHPTPAADGVYATVGWSAGTHGRDQRVVRIENGTERWTGEHVDRFLVVLATADGKAFVGTADDQMSDRGEELFSLAADGTERWRVESGDATGGVVHDGRLYGTFGSRQVVAIDTGTGGEVWQSPMRSVDGIPDPASGLVFVRSDEQSGEGYPLAAVDAVTGRGEWSFVAATGDDSPFVPTGAVRQGDTVYVTEYGGTLFALDASDGTERWRYGTDGDTRKAPLVVGDTIYLGALDDGVHAVHMDGTRRWRHGLEGPVWPRGADGDGIVVAVIGREESDLVALGTDGEERWSFTTDGRPNPTATVGSRVYLGTDDGFLVALDG